MVGPTFYGVASDRKVNTIPSNTTVYDGTTSTSEAFFKDLNMTIFPNPTSDLIAIQVGGLAQEDIQIELIDHLGKVINSTKINKGTTIAYFDTRTLYAGHYFIRYAADGHQELKGIVISRD